MESIRSEKFKILANNTYRFRQSLKINNKIIFKYLSDKEIRFKYKSKGKR